MTSALNVIRYIDRRQAKGQEKLAGHDIIKLARKHFPFFQVSHDIGKTETLKWQLFSMLVFIAVKTFFMFFFIPLTLFTLRFHIFAIGTVATTKMRFVFINSQQVELVM